MFNAFVSHRIILIVHRVLTIVVCIRRSVPSNGQANVRTATKCFTVERRDPVRFQTLAMLDRTIADILAQVVPEREIRIAVAQPLNIGIVRNFGHDCCTRNRHVNGISFHHAQRGNANARVRSKHLAVDQ